MFSFSQNDIIFPEYDVKGVLETFYSDELVPAYAAPPPPPFDPGEPPVGFCWVLDQFGNYILDQFDNVIMAPC